MKSKNIYMWSCGAVLLAAVAAASFYGVHVKRGPASIKDVAIVGPNSEIFLVYSDAADADSVVVQKCPMKVIKKRSDCDGTVIKKFSKQYVADRFKMALRLPELANKLDAQMKKKVEVYNAHDPNLAEKVTEVKEFVVAYGRDNVSSSDLALLDSFDPSNEQVIKEINVAINTMMDDIFATGLKTHLFSKGKSGLAYNLFRSLVDTNFVGSFVPIARGEFMMGSPSNEGGRSSDEVLHPVTLTKDFEMQATTVTQQQWFDVMGANPSYFADSNYCPDTFMVVNGAKLCPSFPVERVSWNDAQNFIKVLNDKKDGFTYRLPTEAEWEYAARAGTTTAYSFGDSYSSLRDYAWFDGNANNQTHAVGTRKANPWGLYDMHGNVWQWVSDYYGTIAAEASRDPQGSASGSYRVLRGGSWVSSALDCRSADRNIDPASVSYRNVGFRLVRTPAK